MLHCAKCNRILMDKTADGWKLRTRMVLFTSRGASALCPSCKTANPVPINLTDEPKEVPNPKLFVQA